MEKRAIERLRESCHQPTACRCRYTPGTFYRPSFLSFSIHKFLVRALKYGSMECHQSLFLSRHHSAIRAPSFPSVTHSSEGPVAREKALPFPLLAFLKAIIASILLSIHHPPPEWISRVSFSESWRQGELVSTLALSPLNVGSEERPRAQPSIQFNKLL